MIAPLQQTTIKGAIWYQGEANSDISDPYACTFPGMIASWRKVIPVPLAAFVTVIFHSLAWGWKAREIRQLAMLFRRRICSLLSATRRLYRLTDTLCLQGWTELSPMFPFGFVQLSADVDSSLGFPLTRWRQTANYGVVPNPVMPAVFMAVAYDLGDADSPYGSVHPRYKVSGLAS